MKVQLTWEDDSRLVLTCSGEIDWDAQEELVKRTAEAVGGRERPQVLIDLESVRLITSAGLGSILQLRKLVDERGGRLALACAPPVIAQLFRTVGLDRHIPMVATLEQGREMLAESPPTTGRMW